MYCFGEIWTPVENMSASLCYNKPLHMFMPGIEQGHLSERPE